MPPEVDDAVLDVLHSGYVTQGPKVDEFEWELSRILGNNQVTSLNSGTSAITLALRLAHVKPGDEVIATPMTCVASNVPIMAFGAKIVWADVHPITGLIDINSVAEKITEKTKAILTVDWGGLPVDYTMLSDLTLAKEIRFISDAAHSFGAKYEKVPVGNADLADFTAFSFQAIKSITTVDGGALAYKYLSDYRKGKLLRWFGVDRENTTDFRGSLDVADWGYKFHMNDLNAAIGLVQLKYLEEVLEAQRLNAARYDAHLDEAYRRDREVPYGAQSANWLYTLILPRAGMQDAFRQHMAERGVEVSQVHWRNDRLSVFKKFFSAARADRLTGVDYYTERMMNIPVHSALTEEETAQVIDAANDFV